MSIFITLFLIEAVAQSHITDIAISNEIDPVTKIYKKISVDSIRRTEDTYDPYSLLNYEKEKEVLKIQDEFLFDNQIDICSTRLILTMMAFRLNKYDEAIDFGQSILNIIEEYHLELSNEFMLNLLSNLASAYFIHQDFDLATKTYEDLLRYPMSENFKVYLLNDMASNYLQQGKITEAQEAYREAYNIALSLDDSRLNNLLKFTSANIYRLNGEFQKCLNEIRLLIDEGIFISDEPYISNKIRYMLLESAMWSAHMLGDDKEAMRYGQIFKDCENLKDIDPLTLAQWLLNYSIVESSYIEYDKPDGFPDISDEEMSNWLNRFRGPLETKKQVFNIYKDILGENSDGALNTMVSIASLLGEIGAFQECGDICIELIDLCEKVGKTDSSFYQLALFLLCNLDIIFDEYWDVCQPSLPTNTITIADKLRAILEERGTNYTNNVCWATLFNIYIKYKIYDTAAYCLSNHYHYKKDFISSNLLQIEDLNTISLYWQSISDDVLNGVESQNLWNNPQMRELFYDKALMYKGMKLELFNSLHDEKRKDILLNLTWRDVKSTLHVGEAAIEIVKELDYGDDGSHNTPTYYALIISNNVESPELRYLCSEAELFKYDPKVYYNSADFTKCVFGPILEFINENDITTVYFSPMGEYSNIGLEYLKRDSGEILSDKYNMIRLSSTRELCLKNDNNHPSNLVAFGDINFNSQLSETIYDGNKKSSETLNYLRTSLRGQIFKYLKGTAIELDSISRICDINNIDFTAFRREDASENSFRLLKIGHPDILHIATHGFYWNDNNDNQDYQRQLQYYYNVDKPPFIEDKSMLNSGLVLAGANETLREGVMGNPQNDGILTAQEISQMNFKDVDLVVLSACQSGLGEVMGDGVFGLQRGFKQAGVNSIIMSLWEVDDDATQLLMTEFYKNYLSGKSKRESLLNAQKLVRETPGFEDPEYWAAFVLLDALN